MPYPLNNVATQDAYNDSVTTALFPLPRASFSVIVSNAAVFYQLAGLGPADREAAWEPTEHQALPSLLSFRDPVAEGLPPGTKFAGIRFRSAASGVPARVTVA